VTAHHEPSEVIPLDEAAQRYSLNLERWWVLVRQHLAHPSADIELVALDPARELLMRSGWDWAGTKSILDQAMAVATTQLLQELAPVDVLPSDSA